MHGAHEFLKALAVVLCVAAVTTVVFQRLRQPIVLGYVVAGVIVGPYVPIPLVADREIIQTLSELGVILLMFSLGLEFSLRKLVQVGPTASVTAIIQSSIMVWLGFVVGRVFGWTTKESIFAGAIIAISSTTIIAKAFDEQGVKGRIRELVVGVLIVEDLIAILLMAVLTGLSSGDGVSAVSLAKSSGRLLAFLGGLIVVGMLVVPRLIRTIIRLERPETTLVASVGICFATALLAQEFGYSVALGAFVAGSLVAESGEEKQVEHLVAPVRDMFAAIFFVSVGMLIDPAIIVAYWPAVLTFTVVVIVGKVLGVSLGAFLTGNGTRTSVRAGLSLAQIGEFSFIIAALGISLRSTGDFLYPIAVAVSAITTLTTPWLIRASEPVGAAIDRALPKPVQTFVALYGTWIEQLKKSPGRESTSARAKRLIRLLVLDLALLSGAVIGAALSKELVARVVSQRLGLDEAVAHASVIVAAVVLSAPFVLGAVRLIRSLGFLLGNTVMPQPSAGALDHARTPRRVLVVSLQLGILVVVGLPLMALLQPFISMAIAAGVLGTTVVVLSVVFWRTALDLQGHVKAGAQLVVETLTAQAQKGAMPHEQGVFAEIEHLLPGVGKPVQATVAPSSRVVGRSLAELNLRGVTGASVLAIARGELGVLVPTAGEVLHAGDILALAGTEEAVAAASSLVADEKAVS